MSNLMAVLSLLLVACSRAAPSAEPAPPGMGSSASVEDPETGALPLQAAAQPASDASTQLSPAAAASSATPVESAAGGGVLQAPALRDGEGKLMPQTEDKPRTDSAFFQAAARELFAAIVSDDAARALPFFFPVQAYELVKDVANPARDWQQRLVKALGRDIHEYHRLLGRRRAETRFLRLEVPEPRAEWMKPGREGNRLGYYRVLRSRLLYADEAGKERALEVTSLISWRGEWYVVHLHGFE